MSEMKYHIKSLYGGRYSKTKQGITNSVLCAKWWRVKFTVIEFVRVIKLNLYHYGNIFGLGKKRTDDYGRRYKY